MNIIQIEEACFNLESGKVGARRKACEELNIALSGKTTISTLNERGSQLWNTVLKAIQGCLERDVDVKKRGSVGGNTVAPMSLDLFYTFVQQAAKEDAPIFTMRLVHSMLNFLKKDAQRRTCGQVFSRTISQNILSNWRVRSCLAQSSDWEGVYNFFKSLCNWSYCYEELHCLYLVIKFGPCHSLALETLKHEFDFITKICNDLSASSPILHQELIVKILNEFCKHTAKDFRSACCQLGEDVLPHLTQIYERNLKEDKLKTLMIEFFAFQVTIHNPGGVSDYGHSVVFVASQKRWLKCLANIHEVVNLEVDSSRTSSLILKHDNISQFRDCFVRIFVLVTKQIFDYKSSDKSDEEPQAKRKRLDVGFHNLIDKIRETKSWCWVSLTSSLIETYPSLIKSSGNYTGLLQNLMTLLLETKDPNLSHHLIKCLYMLQKSQAALDFITENDKAWDSLSDYLLRSMGSNRYNHLLLQIFVTRRLIKPESILKHYKSDGVLQVTEDTLSTLETIFRNSVYLQTDCNVKSDIIKWILNEDNVNDCSRVLTLERTSRVLIYLLLKQWPCDFDDHKSVDAPSDSGIEEIYFLSTFETLVGPPIRNKSNHEATVPYCIDGAMQIHFLDLVKDVAQKFNLIGDKKEDLALNFTILLINLTDNFLKHGLITEDQVQTFRLFNLTKVFAKIVFGTLKFRLDPEDCHERQLDLMIERLKLLKLLFGDTDSVALGKKLREDVPEDFIRSLFVLLASEQKKFKENHLSSLVRMVKMSAVEVLTCFSIFPRVSSDLLDIQRKSLTALLGSEYDSSDDIEFQLILTLLTAIKQCDPVRLSNDDLVEVFNKIQNMCEFRYRDYYSASKIIQAIYDIFPLIVRSSDSESVDLFINVLRPFYENRHSYGPEVSLKILNCLILLHEQQYGRWSGDYIYLDVPELLTSPFQEVRFRALKYISDFFKMEFVDNDQIKQQYQKQRGMFSKIVNVSESIFEEGDHNMEQNIVSVTHTLSTILVTSSIWKNEALFALLKVSIRNKVDIKRMHKILTLIATKLGYESDVNLLEDSLVPLYTRWSKENLPDFPIELFNLKTVPEFYEKYWDVLSPVLILNSSVNVLREMSSSLKKPKEDLIQAVGPMLLSWCIALEEGQENITSNKIYKLLVETLGSNTLAQIFKADTEKIVLFLLEMTFDDAHFKTHAGIPIIFAPDLNCRLSVAQLGDRLQFIEESVFEGNSLIQFLMEKSPEKIHWILLRLELKIHKSVSLYDKMRCFHIYFVFMDMVLDSLARCSNMTVYIVRQMIYFLLGYIKSHKELGYMSCNFLKSLLEKTVAIGLSQVLSDFIFMIVNRLKIVAAESDELGPMCLEILNFLIVKNGKLFEAVIGKIDSFPSTRQFRNIFEVHHGIKYHDKAVDMEDEIRQFLEFGQNEDNFDECHHSLAHLRDLLTNHKMETGRLYDQIRDTRRFSEDCADSLLHGLICTLVRLSLSSSVRVREEALRCLGIIGASNLETLVLRPEGPLLNLSKWQPWEVTVGNIVSLLTKYLVDPDALVVNAASEALFKVLKTKEGRKVTDSQCDFGSGVPNKSFLTPFLASVPSKNAFNISLDLEAFAREISDDLWTPVGCSHKSWVSNLTCSILGTFYEQELFLDLVAVAQLKTDFCEHVLPLIVYTILYQNLSKTSSIIARGINPFFSQHWDITVQNLNAGELPVTLNKSSVQCMLNVVDFVRLQQSMRVKKKLKDVCFNYLQIAQAAQFCTAQFTAILYAEQWCEDQIVSVPNNSGCSSTKLDAIYQQVDEVMGKALHNILRKAYSAIGESDALMGCGTFYLLDPNCRVEYFKETGQSDKVILHYETGIISNASTQNIESLNDAFNNSSLYQMSLIFSTNLTGSVNYECLWRLGQWDYNDTNCHEVSEPGDNFYHRSKFYGLKALLRNQDEFSFKREAKNIRDTIVRKIKDVNLENCKNIYQMLARLQALKEMEEFANCTSFGNIFDADKVVGLIQKWRTEDAILSNEFEYIEPIKAQRVIMLSDFIRRCPDNQSLQQEIFDFVLTFAEYCRLEGPYNVAFRTLSTLQNLCPLSDDLRAKVRLQEAQLFWNKHEDKLAKCILSQICTNERVSPRLLARAYNLTGAWMAQNLSESRQTIIDNYFLKSLSLLKNVQSEREDERTVLETYHQLASFADREYQQVMSHIKSGMFQRYVQNMKKSKQVVSDLKDGDINNRPKDFKKALAIKEKLCSIDEIEFNNIQNERNNLLMNALKYYLLNLYRSDDHNITIFRLFSLILENRSNEIVSRILETELSKIPSYKFINILPQMIPHIDSNDHLGRSLNKIVERCALDHPYHTLPLLLSLVYANKDRDYAESKASVNDTRINSASALLNRIKKTKLETLVTKMELLSEALIELAYIYKTSEENKKIDIPKNARIRQIRNFDDVLLPTCQLEVRKSCDYSSNIVGIHSYNTFYTNVGGINLPKRLKCRGTDGIERTQLVKGKDDLRQDAVMQQVFTIMNSLLAVNKQSKDLLIRTYKIVPLSMRSGVLEWVENSLPLGEYLTGKDEVEGAHQKYRPDDRTPNRCRGDFKRASALSTEGKLRIYNDICQKIQPVLHKFLETSFPQPTIWYERRRAYIRSVATSSMCGYILGIGDRHVNNILLDKDTAEVIHIDFGIAFEQGRVLPTPETVPFRLTRDIVDGMGVSGVEGVFRRSCEKTMEVLRVNRDTIISILEVLLYDPLYDWTVSTAEANKRQRDQDSEVSIASISPGGDDTLAKNNDVNDTAERALLRLRQKLQGIEHGQLMSVEHQVGSLIQQAMDATNLCRVYNGWQPYL